MADPCLHIGPASPQTWLHFPLTWGTSGSLHSSEHLETEGVILDVSTILARWIYISVAVLVDIKNLIFKSSCDIENNERKK